MAWVFNEACGQLGSRTSPMPRRYCSTSMWSTKCNGPVAVIEITPRYWWPLVSEVTEPLAGTAHNGRPDVATAGAGGGGGDVGGGWEGGRVVVVVTGFGSVVVVGNRPTVVVVDGDGT